MASNCSIVYSEPSYIGFTLLTFSEKVNNTPELGINDNSNSNTLDPNPALNDDAKELRKKGIVKKGPKSKKQGWDLTTLEKNELEKNETLKDWERQRDKMEAEDRRLYLQTAELKRDPRNWFDLVSEHKSIEVQFRDRKLAILKKEEEEEAMIAWKNNLVGPLDKEWDYSQ